jgi:hypothetical protein
MIEKQDSFLDKIFETTYVYWLVYRRGKLYSCRPLYRMSSVSQ